MRSHTQVRTEQGPRLKPKRRKSWGEKPGPREAAPPGKARGDAEADSSHPSHPSKGARQESLRARIVREGHFFFALAGEGRERVKYVLPKSMLGSAKAGQSVLI